MPFLWTRPTDVFGWIPTRPSACSHLCLAAGTLSSYPSTIFRSITLFVLRTLVWEKIQRIYHSYFPNQQWLASFFDDYNRGHPTTTSNISLSTTKPTSANTASQNDTLQEIEAGSFQGTGWSTSHRGSRSDLPWPSSGLGQGSRLWCMLLGYGKTKSSGWTWLLYIYIYTYKVWLKKMTRK